MNKQELNEVYDAIFGVAQNIIKSGEECEAVLFVVTEDGGVLPVDVSDAPSKDAIAIIQQSMVQSQYVYCVILLIEAYMAKVLKDDVEGLEKAQEAASKGKLKNFDGREEVVLLSFLTKTDQALAVCKIKREEGKSHLEKGEINWSSESGRVMSGRFVREQSHTFH